MFPVPVPVQSRYFSVLVPICNRVDGGLSDIVKNVMMNDEEPLCKVIDAVRQKFDLFLILNLRIPLI